MTKTIPSIELWGSPALRGRRHGQLLGAEIRQMRRALLTYLARISLYAGAAPLYGLVQLLARSFLPYMPAPLKQEMSGIAAGAEVGLGTVLLINVTDDLANNSPRCSALAVGEGQAASETFLMGRNLDYPLFVDLLRQLQTLFRLEPDQGQALASVAWPGYVGVCTGINRAGVALAQLSAVSRDRTLKGMPAAMRFRLALEAGETVAATVEHLLRLPGTIGNNLVLCGPKEAVVVELSARHWALRPAQQGLLTATNHYQSPKMQPWKGRFPPRPPYSVLSPYQFTEAYSEARNARLQELAAGKKLGPRDIQTILADERIANPGTAVCTVFSPARRILWVARGDEAPVNRGPFEEVRLWS